MQKLRNIFQHAAVGFKKPMVVHPNNSWIVILITTAILLLIVSVFSWLLFFTTVGDDTLIVSKTVGPQPEFIKQDKLKKVLDAYTEKEAMFLKLSSEPYTIADPSL